LPEIGLWPDEERPVIHGPALGIGRLLGEEV